MRDALCAHDIEHANVDRLWNHVFDDLLFLRSSSSSNSSRKCSVSKTGAHITRRSASARLPVLLNQRLQILQVVCRLIRRSRLGDVVFNAELERFCEPVKRRDKLLERLLRGGRGERSVASCVRAHC